MRLAGPCRARIRPFLQTVPDRANVAPSVRRSAVTEAADRQAGRKHPRGGPIQMC